MNDNLLLLLAYWFPPDNVSGARRPGCFAKYLGEFGYAWRAITAARSSDPRVTSVPPEKPRLREAIAGKTLDWIQRLAVPYDDRLSWVSFATAAGREILNKQPKALILSTSPPVATHLAALALKRQFGLPWVADFRDPLCGNPWRSRKWIYPYDAWVEFLVFRHADLLIANTDTVARVWQQRYPSCRRKIRCLPNGFEPATASKALELPERSCRVLSHVGSLYGGRDPGLFLRSFLRLLRSDRERPEVLVRLVGEIDSHIEARNEEVLNALSAEGAVQFDGTRRPKAEADRIAAESDYLLLLDINSANTDLQVPAKLYDYVKIGRPILAFTKQNSPTDRILLHCGIPSQRVYIDDPQDEIDKKLQAFFSLSTEPSPTSLWFDETFNCQNQVRRMAGWLDELRVG